MFLRTIFIVVIVLFLYSISFAQETVTLTVTGNGATQEEARDNALRSAIEQAFGVFISSNTEIVNDEIIRDEIVSVSSGNIQEFEVLNSTQLDSLLYTNTVIVTVSVKNLTNFVKARGIKVEFEGGLFAANVRQQELNKLAELEAVKNMYAVLNTFLQDAYDFEIKVSEPEVISGDNYLIKWTVTSYGTKNIEKAYDYLEETLVALSMKNKEERKNYLLSNSPPMIKIRKGLFRRGTPIYLRNYNSVRIIRTFLQDTDRYAMSHIVNLGIDMNLISNPNIFFGRGSWSKGDYTSGYPYNDIFKKTGGYGYSNYYYIKKRYAGKPATVTSHQMEFSLEEVEKISAFTVKPKTNLPWLYTLFYDNIEQEKVNEWSEQVVFYIPNESNVFLAVGKAKYYSGKRVPNILGIGRFSAGQHTIDWNEWREYRAVYGAEKYPEFWWIGIESNLPNSEVSWIKYY